MEIPKMEYLRQRPLRMMFLCEARIETLNNLAIAPNMTSVKKVIYIYIYFNEIKESNLNLFYIQLQYSTYSPRHLRQYFEIYAFCSGIIILIYNNHVYNLLNRLVVESGKNFEYSPVIALHDLIMIFRKCDIPYFQLLVSTGGVSLVIACQIYHTFPYQEN